MKLLKQCSIAFLGIVIITYVIIKVFEEDALKEGIPPFVIPPDFVAGSMAFQTPSRLAADITEQVGDTVRHVADSAQSAAETTTLAAQSAGENVAEISRDIAGDVAEEAADTSRFVAERGDEARAEATEIIRDVGMEGKATGERLAGEVEDVVSDATTKGGLTWMFMTFMFIIFTSIGYIVDVGNWMIKAASDTVKFFSNFTGCFFWYFLEIIGQILYLPIRFIVWIFDISGISLPRKIEEEVWKVMHIISCKCYEFTSFHLIYYSQDIIQKCYTFKAGAFPNPVAHFKKVFAQKDAGQGIKQFFGGSV